MIYIVCKLLLRLAVLAGLVFMMGCASLSTLQERIPGLDRITHRFSKAEVGPVKTESGEIIPGTETSSQHIDSVHETAAPAQIQTVKPNENLAKQPEIVPTVRSENPSITQAQKPRPKKPAALPANTKSSAPVKKTDYSLSGNITLLAKTGEISPEGVIVRLKNLDGLALQQQGDGATHDMDMIEKVYAPGQMTVRKGDTVNFINKDAIQHNVFSSSGDNAFDLGTFGGGLQREVRLNEEGIVKVYCNIHPNMAAFVAVDDMGISQVVRSADGFFKFSDLPSGEYQLTLWSVRGEQIETLTLSDQKNLHLDLNFDTSSYEPPKRINKFGEQYKKKRVRREYY